MKNTKDKTNIWIDIDKASEMIGLSSLYLYETDRIIAEQQKKRGCG